MLDIHTLAIVAHALSATGAVIVSIGVLVQRQTPRQLQFAKAGVALLVLMEVFLIIAILAHFTSLPTLKQFIFGGLAVLLVYIIWRAVQAVAVLRDQPGNQIAVTDHIGFVLISLVDGFAIVSALDFHAPGWLVAVIAVGTVALGVAAITVRKESLARQHG